jgi:hypothetical protein
LTIATSWPKMPRSETVFGVRRAGGRNRVGDRNWLRLRVQTSQLGFRGIEGRDLECQRAICLSVNALLYFLQLLLVVSIGIVDLCPHLKFGIFYCDFLVSESASSIFAHTLNLGFFIVIWCEHRPRRSLPTPFVVIFLGLDLSMFYCDFSRLGVEWMSGCLNYWHEIE